MTRPWLIRYYAGNLRADNWSSQGFAKELLNAKKSAVVHIIIEHWHSARIYNRRNGKEVCILTRTAAGITVKVN